MHFLIIWDKIKFFLIGFSGEYGFEVNFISEIDYRKQIHTSIRKTEKHRHLFWTADPL